MGMFSKRTWLNKDNSSFTGSVVAFHGETTWHDKPEITSFLEITDCHGKIRLHRGLADSMTDFRKKLQTLSSVINDFDAFLASEEENK